MEAESTQSTDTYLKILAWLHANQKRLTIGGSIVVVIGLVIGYMSWQKSETESSANADLLHIPLFTIRGNQLVPTPAEPFMDVAKKYPDTSAGEYADLLAAEALFTSGKYPEAHQQFARFVDAYPASQLVSQAQMGIAASLEGEGKIPEAAQKYQEIISIYGSDPGIVSPAKLTLARLYEQLNKPELALNYYSELARINNPYDPWAAEARERGTLLLSKHPELRKAPPTQPGASAPGSGQLSPSVLGGKSLAPQPSTPAPAAPPAKH